MLAALFPRLFDGDAKDVLALPVHVGAGLGRRLKVSERGPGARRRGAVIAVQRRDGRRRVLEGQPKTRTRLLGAGDREGREQRRKRKHMR